MNKLEVTWSIGGVEFIPKSNTKKNNQIDMHIEQKNK